MKKKPYPGFPEFLQDRHFGPYGGAYVPELLLPALQNLEEVFYASQRDKKFLAQLDDLRTDYAGRPTPLFYAENLSKHFGIRIFIKNEGLLHTGAHKLNNALGQALLCKKWARKK